MVDLESIAASPPATALTPGRRAMEATDEADSAPSPSVSERLSTCWTVLPGLKAYLLDPGLDIDAGFNGGGALVTVTSVPTPYSECSTAAWALLTPADAAVTVTTRPTPTARPTAISSAWR